MLPWLSPFPLQHLHDQRADVASSTDTLIEPRLDLVLAALRSARR